jgi:hypothetical protein
MSLEKALKKFAKPGKLLLPIPRQGEAWKYAQQYFFKSIDLKKITNHIKRKRNEPPKEFHFSPSADTSSFEHSIAEIFILLMKGMPVGIQVHREGPRSVAEFKKMLHARIYLRPDVILAALPEKSRIIFDPQTNFEKVCWVIAPPYKTKEGMVKKPFSGVLELYERGNEVPAALTTPENEEVEDEPGFPC